VQFINELSTNKEEYKKDKGKNTVEDDKV